jgi:hypothetical protein
MAEWFKKRLESFLDNVIFAVIIAGIAAMITAIKSQPLPVIIGVFVSIIIAILVALRLIITLGQRRHIAKTPQDESKKKRQLKLDVGKLLLDGKEILVDLEKMNAQLDSMGAVSAELKFDIWYKDVSKTLQNTDYDQLRFEDKEGLDYRKAKKSDYVEACKYGLGRLEYIKQLMFDKEGSQTE